MKLNIILKGGIPLDLEPDAETNDDLLFSLRHDPNFVSFGNNCIVAKKEIQAASTEVKTCNKKPKKTIPFKK